ncbi:hypothetical protein MJG53_012131 [Ovis ammon polii x Ovis aries]|uniref:Uncharacterized protein n=1 Tax=Ovis ammon polii x Ovis aries TaxID=2918886 RepID=A0ACB9UQ42_9CETA|nr:hypothetical protein MJG53_012131 [Ovis ammon polii x Ovis aries]
MTTLARHLWVLAPDKHFQALPALLGGELAPRSSSWNVVFRVFRLFLLLETLITLLALRVRGDSPGSQSLATVTTPDGASRRQCPQERITAAQRTEDRSAGAALKQRQIPNGHAVCQLNVTDAWPEFRTLATQAFHVGLIRFLKMGCMPPAREFPRDTDRKYRFIGSTSDRQKEHLLPTVDNYELRE